MGEGWQGRGTTGLPRLQLLWGLGRLRHPRLQLPWGGNACVVPNHRRGGGGRGRWEGTLASPSYPALTRGKKGFDPPRSSMLKRKGRKTYVQTHTALAHAIDRPANGNRLPGTLTHPEQPRRRNHAWHTHERACIRT